MHNIIAFFESTVIKDMHTYYITTTIDITSPKIGRPTGNKSMKIFNKVTGTIALALGCVAIAQADTIRATSGLGPTHVLATEVYPELFRKLGEFTEGRWDGRDTPSGLVALNEMNAGLRDGVTQLGAVILPYFAADFPESSMPLELAVLGTDNRAISAATTEYIVTCAECVSEFTESGQVFLGMDATTPYNFLSTKPIRTAANVKGLRIRSGGPLFARIIESLGGVPVQMPASELFEGLSQGVIDATFSSTPDLINSRLMDAVGYVTEIETGVFNGAAVVNASGLLWMGMTEEDRASLARAAQYAVVTGLDGWRSTEAQAKEQGADQVVEFITPDATLKSAVDDFLTAHLETVAQTLTERGVSDATAKVARYQELLAKWEGLVSTVETPEALAELRYEKIWSQIDYADVGL